MTYSDDAAIRYFKTDSDCNGFATFTALLNCRTSFSTTAWKNGSVSVFVKLPASLPSSPFTRI